MVIIYHEATEAENEKEVHHSGLQNLNFEDTHLNEKEASVEFENKEEHPRVVGKKKKRKSIIEKSKIRQDEETNRKKKKGRRNWRKKAIKKKRGTLEKNSSKKNLRKKRKRREARGGWPDSGEPREMVGGGRLW